MSQGIKLDAKQAENFGQLRVVPTLSERKERRSKPSLALRFSPRCVKACAADLLQMLKKTDEAHHPDRGRFRHIETLAEEAKLAAKVEPLVELGLGVLFLE